jgi:hypothetical protein
MACKGKDYGENDQLIRMVFWYLENEYLDGEVREVYRRFLTKAGAFPVLETPQDFEISIRPADAAHQERVFQMQSVNGAETTLYVSSDESGSSIPRRTRPQSRNEFDQTLREWYENTDEETISNQSEFGKADWLLLEDAGREFYLNADAHRDGIERYLDMLAPNAE